MRDKKTKPSTTIATSQSEHFFQNMSQNEITARAGSVCSIRSSSSTSAAVAASAATITTPAESGSGTNPPDSAKDILSARRARKRATDRRSQREHRLRRQAYVTQLEETVRVLKAQLCAHDDEDGSSSGRRCGCGGGGRLASLMEEHDRLGSRYMAVVAKLRRVGALINEDLESANIVPLGVDLRCVDTSSGATERSTIELTDESGHRGQPATTNGSQTETTARGNDDGRQATNDNTNSTAQPTQRTNTSVSEHTDVFGVQEQEKFADGEDWLLDALVADHQSASSHQPKESHGISHPTLLEIDIDLDLDSHLDPHLDSHLKPSLLPIEVAPLDFETDIFEMEPMSVMGVGPVAPLQQPIYVSPPRHSPAVGRGALLLQEMIVEGRMESYYGRFDTSEPSLRRLLSPTPKDIIAYRLFHYLRSYGDMPLHHFLAIFWVQYLRIRWQVLCTEEDYKRLPPFLRPTPFERVTPHNICIDMFVWPDLREAIIKDSSSLVGLDVERLGEDLVKNLRPTWSYTSAMPISLLTGRSSTSLVASLDILTMIEQQAMTWEFWKLGPGFIEKFPQFVGCQLG